MLIAIVGASGAGKSTLLAYLERDCGMGVLPSYTTRATRGIETESNYRFVDEATYFAMEQGGHFALSMEYGGFRYGTRREDVETSVMANRPFAATLTVDGVAKLRMQGFYVCAAFLHVDQVIARRRMQSRGDDIAQIEARIKRHPQEMEAVLAALAHGHQFLILDGLRAPCEWAADLVKLMADLNR